MMFSLFQTLPILSSDVFTGLALTSLLMRKPLNEIVMSNVLAWLQVKASNAKHASE